MFWTENYHRSKAIAFLILLIPFSIFFMYTVSGDKNPMVKSRQVVGLATRVQYQKKMDYYDTEILLPNKKIIHLKIGTAPPPEKNKTVPLVLRLYKDGKTKYVFDTFRWQNEGPQIP